MSALEQMRLFFRFCQCVGFFPFRIEIDKETGKFQQFSFSWRNPITWWYVALALAPFFALPTAGVALQDTEINSLMHKASIKLPFTISMSLGLSPLIYFLLILSARFWVTFRFTTLRRAIQQMQIVEQFLGERPHSCRCTIGIRIFIGIVFVVLWIGSVFLASKFVFILLIEKLGYLLTAVIFCAFLLQTLPFFCAILLLHLAYYIMGYYISSLRCELLLSKHSGFVDGWAKDGHFLTTPTSTNSVRTSDEFNSVKKRQRIFGVICRASAEWNRIFSFPALFIIASKLPTSSFTVFNFLQGLIVANVVLTTMRWQMLINFLGDIILMAIVFTAADIPVQDAKKLKEKIIEINNNRLLIHSADFARENLQTIIFLGQIREDRLRLSTGLFSVGIHLVPTIVGSIVTYLVILLQQTREATTLLV